MLTLLSILALCGIWGVIASRFGIPLHGIAIVGAGIGIAVGEIRKVLA